MIAHWQTGNNYYSMQHVISFSPKSKELRQDIFYCPLSSATQLSHSSITFPINVKLMQKSQREASRAALCAEVVVTLLGGWRVQMLINV